MTERQMLFLGAALLVAAGRSFDGAIAGAQELADRLDAQRPDLRDRDDRRAVGDAWRRARDRSS